MFDYFGVLISVIFGLTLTHLLRGLARLIQLRQEARPYWVHIIWTINVIIYVLAIWWGMYWWKGLAEWTAEWFFFIALYSITIFLWAYLLFPAEFEAHLDFDAYYYRNRGWFFGLQGLVCLFDIPETLNKGVQGLRPMPAAYPYVISVLLLSSLVGFVSRNRRVHAVLPIVWLVTLLGYWFLSSLEHIARHFS